MKELIVIPIDLDRKEQEVIYKALKEYINKEKSQEKVEIARNMIPAVMECCGLALTKIEHAILKTALYTFKKLKLAKEQNIDLKTLDKIITQVTYI